MTKSQQKIIIAMCAGEASGDLLGAHLIEALKRQYPQAQFVGIGGSRMKEEGFESLFDQEKLAVRGYFEVLSNLPEILGIRSSLIDELKSIRPHVFVGIDAPDFNLHVAEKLKEVGIPTLHYVSPSVWAWKAKRVHKIVKQVNRVLCLFPMEPQLYEEAGGKALFVGHPLAQILPLQPDKQAAREILKLDADIPVIAILPGSRVNEIEYMAPLFFQAAKLLLRELPTAQFIVPYPTATIRDMLKDLLSKDFFKHLPIRLQAAKTDLACSAADVVLVTSGTATLEVALCKRPMVISYKISPMTYALVKHKIKVKHVGLPNILLGKEVVPELLQNDATGENLAKAVLDWYNNPNKVTQLEMSFIRLHKMLLRNTDELAANAVLEEAGLVRKHTVQANDDIAISPIQHQFNQKENNALPEKSHFSEVGVVGDDGQVYANHAHIPSVTHTLAHKSADMFQEVDDTPIPPPPPKKPGLLARLFGKKQAAESESYAATPRLQNEPSAEMENWDEYDDFNPTKKKPKAVPSPDNPNRLILEVDDLPDAPIENHDFAANAGQNRQRQPNIFDKYRDKNPAPTAKTAAQNTQKENIFSKYMNEDGTAKESIAKKDAGAKPNIFDKYRQQQNETSASPAPAVKSDFQAANESKSGNIFDKYRQNAHASNSDEDAIAESFAAPYDDSADRELNRFNQHQSQPETPARAMQSAVSVADVTAAVMPHQAVAMSPTEQSPENFQAARSRPNIFARHREKHVPLPQENPTSVTPAIAPTASVDLDDVLDEVRNETVIAVHVEDDLLIPEITLNINDEDFIVANDPETGKPILLSKEELAIHQMQLDAMTQMTATETVEVAQPENTPVGARVERILKPKCAQPNEATQPILPKTSFAYKYAMMFQNTSDVRLESATSPLPTQIEETPQVAETSQPETFVAPQMPMPQFAPIKQPETFVAPQIAMSQVAEVQQPETFVEPQIEMPQVVEVQQPETFVAPQIAMPQVAEIQQPETFVEPQIEMPQVAEVQQPETFVAPQIAMPQVTEIQQPEIAAVPQIEIPQFAAVQQPEIAAVPQIEIPQFVAVQQPEIAAVPQIEIPQFVAVQQPEIAVAPQIEMPQVAAEIQQPEISIVPQVEEPQVASIEQPEISIAPETAMPTVAEIQTQPESHEIAEMPIANQEDNETPQPQSWATPDIAVHMVVKKPALEEPKPQPDDLRVQPTEMVLPPAISAEVIAAAKQNQQPQQDIQAAEQQSETPALVEQVQIVQAAEPQPETSVLVEQTQNIQAAEPEMLVLVEQMPEELPETEMEEPELPPMQPQKQENLYQHTPRFSRRYPAKAGYTAANQRLFF